jgi:HrpA-like RNA helicase
MNSRFTAVSRYLLTDETRGMIACTQPRKVAATGLADFVSKSVGSKVGGVVGYDFGFRKKTTPGQTKITFMTNHSMMLSWQKDPELSEFSCIVVDEAHERSLDIDLLLSILKTTLEKRPDFRIVVTSATIDPSAFAKFYSKFSVKILDIPGKIYPIETIWDGAPLDLTGDYVSRSVEKIVQILSGERPEEKKGILAFLATPADTERAQRMLQRLYPRMEDTEVLQFHGKLALEDQQKVLKPMDEHKRYRVIFATNSAETSVTIPDITIVVDSGIAKHRQFDPKRNIRYISS